MAATLTTSAPVSNCTIDPLIEVDKCLYKRVLERTPMDNYLFILFLPIMISILGLGLVGNTLAYVVMSKEMRQSSSTICLKALALADNMVLITYCMYFTTPMFYKYLGVAKWAMMAHELAKPYLWATIWFAKTLSVYIIVQMTIERYIAICKPLSAHRFCTESSTRLGIVAIIVMDFFYNLPKVFQYKTTFECDPCSGDYLPVTSLAGVYRDKYYKIIYVKALYFIIMFVFPLTILFVLNWLLINSIKRATRMRESMSTNVPASNDNATEKIVGVVIAFLVLETPAVILNILYIVKDWEPVTDDHIGVRSGINYQVILILMRSLYVMSTINSCINFYIYCLVGRRFRRILIHTLTNCGKKRSSPESSMTRSTNGATHLEVRTNITKLSNSSLNTSPRHNNRF